MASTTFLFEVSCYVLSIINTAVALEAMELPTFVHPACENETICTLPPPWFDFEAVPVNRQGGDFIADEYMDQCYSKHEFIFQAAFTMNVAEGKALEALGTSTIMDRNCANQTYCTVKPMDYPISQINKLLANLSYNWNFTGGPKSGVEPTHRQGNIENVCPSKDIRGLFYQIVDENDITRWVVQSQTKFLQYISGQVCRDPSPKCENLILDYSFLVLSEDMRSLDIAKIKGGFPVACVARYYEYMS